MPFLFAPDYENPFDDDGDNVFELIVSASDGIYQPVEQTISVEVLDVATETETGPSHLFGPTDLPPNAATNDTTDYELGVRFVAASDGSVTSLRYFRGADDADDTDIRTLNIWTATGVNLGSVVVESQAGNDGWQVGTLSTEVTLEAGQSYVVSYGTEQNCVFSSNFFTTTWEGPDAQLSAPTGGNCVFSSGSAGLFPTQSYNNTNYWVDLTFEATPMAPNSGPVFASGTAFSVNENQTLAATLSATDSEEDDLTFSIVGGADVSRFNLNANSGLLTFAAAPDFETPTDVGADNVYDLIVAVTDGTNAPVEQAISISVLDETNGPGLNASRLFASSDVPTSIATNDPTDYELGVRFSVADNGAITSLLYYRGTEDAGDTDTRTLNLWTDTGVNLGSVTVVSLPGQSGWQYGNLDAPIQVEAGTTYVASYGTEQNYVFNANHFDTDHESDDFILTAPASSTGAENGVFTSSGTGLFPTQSFNATNYWVDVAYEPLEPIAPQADSDQLLFA